ncbi:MAG: hypothetical protein L0Z49_13490 [Actinobacteria bacterium]|nr:hypothetical protein [Actinomycetota bacterium]
MTLVWANEVGDVWAEVRDELERVFLITRQAAQREESFVYVVMTSHLLGRGGAGNAMVAAGLLSAARTAALEGARKGWTVNVISVEADAEPEVVETIAANLLATPAVTGELVRLGPGHLGRALP